MRSLGWSACARWDFAYVYLQAWRNVSPLQNEKHPPRNGYKLVVLFCREGRGGCFFLLAQRHTHMLAIPTLDTNASLPLAPGRPEIPTVSIGRMPGLQSHGHWGYLPIICCARVLYPTPPTNNELCPLLSQILAFDENWWGCTFE